MIKVDVSIRCSKVRVYPRDTYHLDVDLTELDLTRLVRSVGLDKMNEALDEVVAQQNLFPSRATEFDAGDLTNF